VSCKWRPFFFFGGGSRRCRFPSVLPDRPPLIMRPGSFQNDASRRCRPKFSFAAGAVAFFLCPYSTVALSYRSHTLCCRSLRFSLASVKNPGPSCFYCFFNPLTLARLQVESSWSLAFWVFPPVLEKERMVWDLFASQPLSLMSLWKRFLPIFLGFMAPSLFRSP